VKILPGERLKEGLAGMEGFLFAAAEKGYGSLFNGRRAA
jgi:hypothetical protein